MLMPLYISTVMFLLLKALCCCCMHVLHISQLLMRADYRSRLVQ